MVPMPMMAAKLLLFLVSLTFTLQAGFSCAVCRTLGSTLSPFFSLALPREQKLANLRRKTVFDDDAFHS